MWKMTKSNYYEVIEGKTMYYEDYVKKIQKEIVELKEKLDIAEANYDIIYGYFTQVNDLLGTELCEEVLDKILKLQQENKELKKYCCKRNDCCGRLKENNKLTDSEVLTEFEKWLEEKINSPKLSLIEIITFKRCLEELQELKEGKK